MFFSRLLASLVVLIYLASVFGAARLAADEVEALKQIGKKIGKDWNFGVDPCSGKSGWFTPNATKDLTNAVTCNAGCTENSTSCHVVSIILKQQNLPGTLPPELVKLPHLQELDLVRNYLNGSIPKEWGSMQQLVNLSIVGNRLTGSIPKELGNISTLKKISVEFNQLSGAIPPELGNLSVIEELHFTSNYFSGELPGNLAKLTTLKDFRIGANYFTGKIPNFIENWTSLEKLVIQGSGLDGPIPSGIDRLGNMIDLRITDLNRNEGTFPPLMNMKNLQTLILRNCNITGQLPEYLGQLSNLNVLDLSFNKLSGEIPSYDGLSMLKFMYLTGNLLTGSVPGWILNKNFDLSYNHLTYGSSRTSSCQHENVNLFGSFLEGNNSGIVPCLRGFQCPEHYSSLFINCGGKEVMVNGNTKYEDDSEIAGRANFVQKVGRNWALSSTGHFLDGYRDDSYIRENDDVHSELIRDARFSPLSLTYYVFCLINGNYTVRLHFAEIVFTDDETFRSLGRRIFDVYIQGKLVLKDFNIKDAAGGVHKEIRNESTVIVTNQTLEIRFYWAGKGTTGLPDRGDYGPLISAISITPDFMVPSEKGNSISAGIIVGIVAAVAFGILLVLCILWWKGCLWCKDAKDHDLKGLDLQTGSFSLRQIKDATKNFDVANKIGEGGFGPVYKGLLSDGTVIAVKQLSSKSKQGNREFVNEIGMISALQHPHLVKLYGCCIEGSQLLLVYEYMENNSLARALFGPEECQLKLDWPTRRKICIGIAKGLAYLHEESRLKIVHRDIKATNVLLDKNLNPKISDFGLAKLDDEENTHISTRIAGTYGYMAPEYAMWGYLTDKVDVYSFGIVTLEIVSGRSATNHRTKEDYLNLLEWALSLKEKGNSMQLVDPRLGSDFDKEEVMLMINVAFLCSNVTAAVRPTMSSVVSMLEGKTDVQESVSGPRISFDDTELEETKNLFQHSPETSTSNRQGQGISTDGPWTTSSPASRDLYPISFNSEY